MSWENLLVTRLPRGITDADLMSIFGNFKPKSARMMLDTRSGKSKGYGFVLFTSSGAGFRAYCNLNQKLLVYNGMTFPLVMYRSQHDGKIATEPNRALYIRNVPFNVQQEEVLKFLGKFGKLTNYALKSIGQSKGIIWSVFAEYETLEEAKLALSEIHLSTKYFDSDIPLLAKFADTEDAKKARRLLREKRKSSELGSAPVTDEVQHRRATPVTPTWGENPFYSGFQTGNGTVGSYSYSPNSSNGGVQSNLSIPLAPSQELSNFPSSGTVAPTGGNFFTAVPPVMAIPTPIAVGAFQQSQLSQAIRFVPLSFSSPYDTITYNNSSVSSFPFTPSFVSQAVPSVPGCIPGTIAATADISRF